MSAPGRCVRNARHSGTLAAVFAAAALAGGCSPDTPGDM